MAVFGLKEIAGLVNGVLKSAADLDSSPTIQSVSIDSRTIADVHSCLFFALKGVRHNGHQYIGDLYQKGVRSFVVCEPIEAQKYPLAFFVKVGDSLEALQKLAAAVRAKYDYPVLAITGSNGKTIVKEWLYDLLHETVKIIRSP